MVMKTRIWRSQLISWHPNVWDIVAIILVFFIFTLLATHATQMVTPYQLGEPIPISLSIYHLPAYALRTVLRLFIALAISLLFTFVVGYLAAKNKHAERLILPIIDILQSVPVLGFLSITIVGFIALFPNRLLGPECAAIFAIFTCQAWNMCLGFYQSLKTLPHELYEASSIFQLSNWQRFWRVEVPFAMPSLIWNMMMSLSGSWFFITLSEAIIVNNQKIMLPGIGSYIAVAIEQANKPALVHAIVAMLVVILLYDQLLFRPLVAWSEKFRSEAETDDERKSRSLITTLFRRTYLLRRTNEFLKAVCDAIVNFRANKHIKTIEEKLPKEISLRFLVPIWYLFIFTTCIVITFFLAHYVLQTVSITEASKVFILGLYTSLKILILIILCSCIWIPVGVWVGLNTRIAQIVQPIAQILAAFPANLIFPVIVMFIIRFHLNTEIWTAPLMIIGTQWYILFNVIAGTTALPKDLLNVSRNLGVSRWLRWKRFILPGIFPYFITGAITAAGGAWNASIVAEFVNWGDTTLKATGLGAYITEVTRSGDFPRIALGIGIMCLYVLIFNRLIWQPLYNLSERQFQSK
jgi:NitT/TauT family transport system permease protein